MVADAHRKNQAVLVIGGRGYENSGEVVEKIGTQKIREKHSDSKAAAFDLYQLDLENVGSVYWLEAYQDAAKPTTAEEALIEKVLQVIKPRYVFVAFGAPAQENWLVTHKQQLVKHHVRVAMAVGGSFDILTGILSRAPSLFLKLNLEWLYRLIQEPWRWKRQLQLVSFIKLVIQSVLE
jgi:exopolysaccharide biosynthesis WecB/TagA/CpsF family protein